MYFSCLSECDCVGSPARLEKFSVSYLSDRYSRSGFQELGLLWSGQRGQISHNAVQQLSICQQRATVLLSCIMACRYSTSSVRSSSAARLHSCFREESSIGSVTDESCCCHGYQGDEESFGGYHGNHQYTRAGQQVDWSLGDNIHGRGGSGVGVVRAMGDSYFLSADVSGFEPHEVVLLAYNQCVVIHAEKTAADGTVAGRFTHKSVLPADMDPLSVSSSLTEERMLIISVRRRKSSSSTLKLTSDLPGSQHSVVMD
uniref:SHSP domain-containing protein n=1 Tax=Cyprinus carpio TaxID=7962 RepID=A0A8C2I9X3_CYPCA